MSPNGKYLALVFEQSAEVIVQNQIIDEEYITMDGTNFSAVAIYEVENGKIAKVTFLR